MKDLVAQFKANPGSVALGGGSAGGSDHILAGMIAQASGVEPAKVNYIAYAGGGEAQAAIMGGHVAAGISGYGEFAAQIKAGKLRALAISSDKRVPGIDIPTLKEQGVDVEMVNWRGVFGAPGITDAQKKELIDDRRQDGQDGVVAGHAEAQRLDQHVPRRRPVQDVPRRRHQAHRNDHRGSWHEEVVPSDLRRRRPCFADLQG